MIFVDSNLFVIDLRYRDDKNYRVNRRALDRLARERQGVTSILNLLEVCGILSFNLSAVALHALYVHFTRRYQVAVLPGAGYETPLPAPVARDILGKIEQRMALKDAEMALAIEQHAESVDALLTWNAKHFAGKVSVPVLTPRDWMRRPRARRARPAR